jgi:hypothetical protein
MCEFRIVPCTRWTELTDACKFHGALAEAALLPTEFRLLNGAPPIVCGRQRDDGTGYRTLVNVLDNSPGIAYHILFHRLS